jgi:hypothetical protein
MNLGLAKRQARNCTVKPLEVKAAIRGLGSVEHVNEKT